MTKLQEDEIVDMLEYCGKNAPESQQAFIASLAEYFENYGRLSKRQQESLEEIYDKC